MRCPFCQQNDDRVVETRHNETETLIRRRRICNACGRRFTTYERIEEMFPLVIKKDGRREAYEKRKVIGGMQKACEKRPVSMATLEKIANDIERRMLELDQSEIDSSFIGELIMEQLAKVDKVAYVRFASVYRAFKDVGEFVDAVKDVDRAERDHVANRPTKKNKLKK